MSLIVNFMLSVFPCILKVKAHVEVGFPRATLPSRSLSNWEELRYSHFSLWHLYRCLLAFSLFHMAGLTKWKKPKGEFSLATKTWRSMGIARDLSRQRKTSFSILAFLGKGLYLLAFKMVITQNSVGLLGMKGNYGNRLCIHKIGGFLHSSSWGLPWGLSSVVGTS